MSKKENSCLHAHSSGHGSRALSLPRFKSGGNTHQAVSWIGLQLGLQGTRSLNRLRAILNDLWQTVKANV